MLRRCSKVALAEQDGPVAFLAVSTSEQPDLDAAVCGTERRGQRRCVVQDDDVTG
jgi:hypothetical protein